MCITFYWWDLHCGNAIRGTFTKWSASARIHTPVLWWRHQMEKFSALLVLCAGNSPVTGEFPSQRPVTLSFDVFFDLRQNYDWVNNREAGDLRRHHTHCDVIVIHSKLQRTAQRRHPPCSSYIKDVFDDFALCRWHKFHYSGVIVTSTSSRGLSITPRASTPPGNERSWHTRLLSTEIKMVYYTYMYKCRPDSKIPLWS